jgi:hypothetical protein
MSAARIRRLPEEVVGGALGWWEREERSIPAGPNPCDTDVMLANVESEGRRHRARVRTVSATLIVSAVAAVGAVAAQMIWDRPGDGGDTVAGTGVAQPDMAEAFDTTRAVVEPLLAVNDSEFQTEQFHLALNQETGDAILYLPHSGNIDVEQLAADAIAAAQATPNAAPVVPVIGVALIDELDAVSVQLFASRAKWATDAADVYWTIPEPTTVSVGVGVAEAEVTAANLPKAVQLPSGATAAIRIEQSYPIGLE